MKSYKDLDVWQAARILANQVYSITRDFPRDEQFGLTSQMRRCSVSIPSNIAEGCGRNHPKNSIQFFFIARGSIYELETQLYISSDQQYLDEIKLNDTLNKLEVTRKLLHGFTKYYQQLVK